MTGALLLTACGSASAIQIDNETMTSNVQQGMISPDGDQYYGGPWKVRIAGGTLDIGVDTIGSAGAEEHTARELHELQSDPSDGYPDFAIVINNESPGSYKLGWSVEGEGPHPIGPHDLGTFTRQGTPVTGRPLSGVLDLRPRSATEIHLWAIQDHIPEPCEQFRLRLFAALSGKQLFDTRHKVVIAHGQTWEHFPTSDTFPPGCIPGR